MFFSFSVRCLFIQVLIIVVFCSYSSLSAETKKQNDIKKDLTPKLAKTYLNNNELTPLQSLPKPVTKLLKKYKIPEHNISVYIRDLNSTEPMLELNADKLRTPASTMKLLTTYAALKELGPNFSWRTEVWLRGELKNGVLDGDLVLKGYGDPFLVYENFWKLIKTLRDKGLLHINGDIIIDESYFDLPKHNSAAFDGKAYRVYNAPASALMFNFQATRFLFKPNPTKETIVKNIKSKSKKKKKLKISGSVDIQPLPKIENFKFINEVKLTSGKCRKSHYRPRFSKDKNGVLVIKGKYAASCKQNFILRTVTKPYTHVFNAFKDFWLDLRGTLKGNVKLGKVSSSDEIFHVYSSPTLGEQIRLINKWSNNVMTKQLLLTLGAKIHSAPATWDKGRTAVLQVLKENWIDTQGISLENGSGLSRTAKISARQMGKLLETAFRDPLMPEFMASMSLPGVDGTLVNRFRKDDLRGRSHLKTGTLDFVTSIAGYMLNRQGKRLVVVVQQNGKKTGAGRGTKIQDALLRWSFEQ